VRRRDLDGCPIAGALQMMGDKWTMLVVRDLAYGPRRMLELLSGLHPMSSRTLVARLRDMENDGLIERMDFGSNPPHVEYSLTERGRLLLPMLDALRKLGEILECNECEDRKARLGFYCDPCPLNAEAPQGPAEQRPPARPRVKDDSIVLL